MLIKHSAIIPLNVKVISIDAYIQQQTGGNNG